MNMLASLKADPEVKIAEDKDTLGGGFGPIESGAYRAKVGMAYVAKSGSGALGLFLTFLVGDEAKEVRQTLYMTSGDAKGNKPYYTKDGENYPLPGFSQAKSLALLTTGKEMSDLDTEEKVVKLYNSEAKAEVPTKVQAVMELIGQEVIIGIIKQTVDKNVKDATGAYVANGETREENEIDKFFCAKEGHENKTTTEIKAKGEAEFYPEWVKKWTGVTRNKTKGAAAGAAGTAGAPKSGAASGGTAKPKSSLFG